MNQTFGVRWSVWNRRTQSSRIWQTGGKELCELSMPEGKRFWRLKNFLEYEESCGKVLKKESEELKKQSETLRMLIQKKEEKNKIFDRLEMEEKQLSILNAKQEEMETCRVQAVLGHWGRAGETSGSAGSSNSEICVADTGRDRADHCMAEGTGKGTF